MNRASLVVAMVATCSAAAASRAAEPAWLGVVVIPVPPPLADQLNLDGKGLMVADVAVDSPADRAGLRLHDVLIAADGAEVVGDAEPFIDMVGARRPGDSMDLAMYRGAKKQTLRVELGERPKERGLRYRYGPDALFRPGWPDWRGKMYRYGPKGWRIEEYDELMDQLRRRGYQTPKPRGWGDSDVFKVPLWPGGEGDSRFEIRPRYPDPSCPRLWLGRAVKGDRVIEVEVRADGDITVRRSVRTKDGRSSETSERSFDGPEGLRDQDPEAYEIYRRMKPDGPPPDDRRPDWWPDREQVEKELEELLDRARESAEKLGLTERELQEQIEKYQQKAEQLEQEIGRWAKELVERWRERPPADGVRFEVHPDGRITVTTRRGPDELTEHFDNEAELQRRRPDLHERFGQLQSPR
ncbi:MAG TPA: PDZ domain-containing protein [Phycisphaerae bacterium]|nr:PDZ domain-containing protein [Phycisphaerae bacterium]